jgi:hypothetical protein
MKRRRVGGILIEASMAITLVAFALVGVAQLMVAAGRQKRTTEWRRLAHREACNVMERIMVRDYDDVVMERLANVALSNDAQQWLPAATLAVEVEDVRDEFTARRVQVEVDWHNLAGQKEQVTLVAWKYPHAP